MPRAEAPASGARVLEPIRPAFRALARSIVPEADRLDEAGWADVEATVESALAKRPAGMRRQFAVFVRLLDFLPRLRWLRPFRKLSDERRTRFLHGIERSRIFLFRRGFWGLRTLVFMGYYGRPQAYAEIGYDAHLRGWLRHADADDDARQATLRAATARGPARDAGPGPGEAGAAG